MTTEPKRTTLQYVLDALVALAAIATLVLSTAKANGVMNSVVVYGDWIAWGIFVLYFFAGVVMADRRIEYVRQNWLILAAIVISVPVLPNQTALVELIRLVILFKLLLVYWRGFGEVVTVLSRRSFIYVVVANAVLVVGGATLLWILEPTTLPNGIGEGLYWAIVTVATVGYGDIVPHTPAGRLLAIVMIIGGLGLLATLTATVASYFLKPTSPSKPPDPNARFDQLDARLERIEALLDKYDQEKTPNDKPDQPKQA